MAFCPGARTTHNISLCYFKAFVHQHTPKESIWLILVGVLFSYFVSFFLIYFPLGTPIGHSYRHKHDLKHPIQSMIIFVTSTLRSLRASKDEGRFGAQHCTALQYFPNSQRYSSNLLFLSLSLSLCLFFFPNRSTVVVYSSPNITTRARKFVSIYLKHGNIPYMDGRR